MGKAKRLRKAKATRKPSRVLREAARAAVRTLAASTLADALGAAIADVMLRRFAAPQFFDGAPCHFCGAEFAARCDDCGTRRCVACFEARRVCCSPRFLRLVRSECDHDNTRTCPLCHAPEDTDATIARL